MDGCYRELLRAGCDGVLLIAERDGWRATGSWV